LNKIIHQPLDIRLHEGDAVTWLRSLPDESLDLIVTDPPYESLEKHRAKGTTTRLTHSKSSSNDWFKVFPNRRFPELLKEIYRVLRRNRHLYVFCDPETLFIIKPAGEAAGFRFWKPLVWDKQHIGMGYHYRARYEFILFFEKGRRRLNNLSIPDVLEAPRVRNRYPSEKPVSLGVTLIKQSSVPGERVADPFMGSASTGEAALSQGCHFWGTDISSTAVQLARTRLGALMKSNTASP
jgi:site-specific DNA-methyltransferase (adenine-specific)